MSDTHPTAQPVENVARGSIFALGAIPVAIIASALLGSLFGIASGLVAIAVAYVAGWLYAKGSGGAADGKSVGPAGRLNYILIASVAIALGAFAGLIAATYAKFSSVGGDGGLLGSPFATTLGRQFSNGDALFPLALCLILGAVGIIGVIRGPKTPPVVAPQPEASTSSQGLPAQPAPYPSSGQNPTSEATPTPPVTPPNQASPGIILNGKPIDPSKQ